MAERSQRSSSNLPLVRRFLQGLYVYRIDEVTAETYGKLKAALFNQFGHKKKVSGEKPKLLI